MFIVWHIWGFRDPETPRLWGQEEGFLTQGPSHPHSLSQGRRTLEEGGAPRTRALQAPGWVPVYPALSQGRTRLPVFLTLLWTT